MSSDSWFGHQSRLVLPSRDRSARGSLAGSLSGLPLVFASMSLGPLLANESRGRLGPAPQGRKLFNSHRENWKIDQRATISGSRYCRGLLERPPGADRRLSASDLPAA